jgi:hypothetical protein
MPLIVLQARRTSLASLARHHAGVLHGLAGALLRSLLSGVCATRRAPRLVLTHHPAITDRVSGQDRSQTAFHESSASCDYAKVFDEPVAGRRVVSANTEESRSEALRSNRGPLVGRHLELEQLRAVPSACGRAGSGWLIRDILRTTKVGGRTLRGRRLFSVLAIFEAKVTGELVTRLSLPPSEASEVARCAAADWDTADDWKPGSSRQSKEQRSSPAFF